jgi:2-dehydropantoate 2-reductase
VKLESDVVERHEGFARSLEPESYSSLSDDLVRGTRMELEALHGSVVRRANEHRLSVPAIEAVHAILRPWAVRNEGASAPTS